MCTFSFCIFGQNKRAFLYEMPFLRVNILLLLYDRNCTVYEDEQSKVIPATGNHSYKDGICTVCGASAPDYQPTEPEEPGESETPSEPSEPSEPVDPSTPDDSHPTETPATGYNSNAVFVVVLLFLSGTGALGMTIYSRKKTKRE